MEFHPAIKVDMDSSVEESFELVLRQDIDADQYRGITHAVPPIEGEFRSRDLFKVDDGCLVKKTCRLIDFVASS